MNADILLEHFADISEAPGAVARLRQLVLELAMRGRLAERDPEEETAADLMSKILLLRKSPAVVEDLDPAEMPFEVPSGWEWVRFGSIVDFSPGRTPSRAEPEYWNTGDYAWVSIADIKDGGEVHSTKETVSTVARQRVFKAEPSAAGTLIMSFKLSIGKVARLATPAYHNEAVISIHPHLDELEPYLFLVLPMRSREATARGAVKGNTLNRKSLSNMLIPLPPLAEQHRIVAKVGELMAVCDGLEAAQEEREARRDGLVASSLYHLAPSPDDEEANDPQGLASSTSFFVDNTGLLFERLEDLERLRGRIADLAVMGRIVPQDSSETPALVALRRVAEREGCSSALELPSADGAPFKVPEGWEWAYFRDVARIESNLVDPAGHLELPHIAPNHIESRTGRLLDYKTVGEDGVTSSKHRFGPRQILYSKIRPALMKVVEVDFEGLCSADMYPIRSLFDRTYLWIYMLSGPFTEQSTRDANRVAMPKINKAALGAVLVPVPPLEEQRRIAARYREIVNRVDLLAQATADIQRARVGFAGAALAAALRNR